MPYLVSVDLGKRVLGVAAFRDGVLVAADEVVNHTPHNPHGAAWAVWRWVLDLDARTERDGPRGPLRPVKWVCEKMQDYPGMHRRAEALEFLRAVATELETMCGQKIDRISARKWKGNLPKRIHQPRVWLALTEAERAAVATKGKESLDAIGLGLWALGRMA